MATPEIIQDIIAESKKMDKKVQGMSSSQLQSYKNQQISAGKTQLAVLAELAALGLTGGLIGAGGKLVYRGLKGAKAMAAARKAISAAKSAAKAKPKGAGVSKAKSAAREATKKPKEQPKKLTQQPKRMPKKKPGTAVATRPTSKPQTTTQRKPMKKADVTASTTRTPKKVTGPAKPAPKPKKTLTKKQKAAIAAAVITGGAAGVKIATTKKPAEAVPISKSKKRPVRPKPDQSIRPKKTKPVVGTGETGPDKSMPKAGKRASNRTSISAGPNTGFGLKGNIFPRDAKERRELMAKFGGTGSRAAKAAMAGTQGNLKK